MQSILSMPGELLANFFEFYMPLIPRLVELLAKLNTTITAPPFATFSHILIGIFLARVLGKKGHVHPCGLRKVGCGCSDYGILDNFVLNTAKAEIVVKKIGRAHV